VAVRERTKYQGVYRRESTDRKFKGKPDICFDISYKADGKKVWEKVGWLSEGYSEKLAADILAERKRSIRHGEELPKQKAKAPTFKDLADKYLKWSKENKNREGIEDKSRYEHHLKPRFDNKRLDEISPFDLERMKSEMAKAGLSPKTISHCLGLIRSMYNRASDWEFYQGENPVKKVKKPVIQNTRDRFLSIEESENLLKELKRDHRFKKEYKELKDPKLHDIALLSLHTGARASEVFNLKGQDIDFRNGLITLRDTKNKETRYAPMTKSVKAMLKRRIPSGREDFIPDAYVFTKDIRKSKDAFKNEPQKIKEVSNAFERAINRLGWNDGVTDPRQKIVFHTCRHTFASWLAIQGTPIFTIAKLMGHKSIAMSERYSHLSTDHKKDAINGLEASLNGNNGKVVNLNGE